MLWSKIHTNNNLFQLSSILAVDSNCGPPLKPVTMVLCSAPSPPVSSYKTMQVSCLPVRPSGFCNSASAAASA